MKPRLPFLGQQDRHRRTGLMSPELNPWDRVSPDHEGLNNESPVRVEL